MFRVSFIFFCFTLLLSSLHGEKIELVALFGQSNAAGKADASKLNSTGVENRVRFKSGRQGRVAGKTLSTQIFGKDSLRFGPEMSFGISFVKKFPDRNLAIYKWAHGGTGLGKHWHHRDSEPDMRFIEQAIKGLLSYKSELERDGHHVTITALIWDQGESDSGNDKFAQAYKRRLSETILHVRTATDSPQLVWIIRRLADWQAKKFKSLPITQRAQDEIAASDPNIHIYNSDSYTESDGVHFDYKGQVKSGIDAFECYSKAYPN